MIRCPKCDADSGVLESRAVAKTIWRRRKCLSCGERWSTYEVTKATVDMVLHMEKYVGAIEKLGVYIKEISSKLPHTGIKKGDVNGKIPEG